MIRSKPSLTLATSSKDQSCNYYDMHYVTAATALERPPYDQVSQRDYLRKDK